MSRALADMAAEEKQAHEKLRAGVREMRDWYIARSQRMQSIYAETFDSRFADRAEYDENVADQLTEILEATDE